MAEDVNSYDLSIHQNPDAAAWAKMFKQYYPDIPEDVMVGWFANAMMAMHDYLLGIKAINGDHLQHIIDTEYSKTVKNVDL